MTDSFMTHDPTTRSAHLYSAALDRDPCGVFTQLAEDLARERRHIVAGIGLIRALRAKLGSPEAMWTWLLDLVIRLDWPMVACVPDGKDASYSMILAPPTWDQERVRGHLARLLPGLEAEYGPADRPFEFLP